MTTRRIVLAAGTALGLVGLPRGARAAPLELEIEGPARALPARFVGGQIEPWFEADLMTNAAKHAAIAPLGLAFTRFPGGSQANFYDWRTGKLDFGIHENASAYRKFWEGLSARINLAYPNGIHAAEFEAIAEPMGLETLIVSNPETQTAAEQGAWFADLKAKSLAPHYVELGNENFYALLGDPTSMARWPDPETAQAICKEHAAAIRPHLPEGAKLGLPVADDGFGGPLNPMNAFSVRLHEWNARTANEPWFDAVTFHPYSSPANILEGEAAKAPADQAAGERILKAMLGHFEDNLAKALGVIGGRFPGKEIWITEWNARGGIPTPAGTPDPVPPPISMHTAIRALLTCLDARQVTMFMWFSLNFSPETNNFSSFVRDETGAFHPTPALLALSWFSQAMLGGADYRRIGEKGGERREGGSTLGGTFAPLTGGLFTGPQGTTLLLHNATAEPRTLGAKPAGIEGTPARIEQLAQPELADQTWRPAAPVALPAALPVELAPWSLTRLVWEG